MTKRDAAADGSGRSGSNVDRRTVLVNGAIVVALVVAAAGGYAAVRLLSASTEARFTVVKDGDGKTHELPLDTDAELRVETDLGYNVVQVRDGRVRVREADCDNQVCVQTGWISRAGEQIVCLPHKLTVDISGGEGTGYDVAGK